MSAALHVAAVVVTHNRLAHLQKAVTALLAEPLDRLLVVDNASSDGSAAWLARFEDPRLHILTLTENCGGAGGFEAGLAALVAEGRAEWMVLLDDDAHPLPGAIAAFRQIAGALPPPCAPARHRIAGRSAKPPVGVIAAAVLTPAGEVAEMNRPALNPFWHLPLLLRTILGGGRRADFHLPESAFAPDAAPQDIDTASFVGFFLHRRVIEQIGLPDGGLFLYGDDVLYSLAARRAGFALRFAPAIRFCHDCRTLDPAQRLRPLWKLYYLCRNNIAVIRQAAGPWLFPLALCWILLGWRRKLRRYPLSEQATCRMLMRAGVRDGLAGRRGRLGATWAGPPPQAKQTPQHPPPSSPGPIPHDHSAPLAPLLLAAVGAGVRPQDNRNAIPITDLVDRAG